MHLPFSNGFLPLTLLALDESEPCGYFPFATAASPAPATTAASQLFSLSASSLSARKDGPPCPIIHSLLYCITPATDSLWTERSYHSSGMSAVFFFSPRIISIYLPCSLFLYPQWLYIWRLSLPWCIPKCQPANGFLQDGNRPGPKEDPLPVCIFKLKLDPSSRAEKLQVSLHMTAFVVLNISQQLAIMIYRCWIVRVMVFSIFKDESLALCLNVLLACFRQQVAMGGSFNRYI